MPDPVTTEKPTNTTPAEETGASHLEAARDFLKQMQSGGANEIDEPTVDTPPAQTKPVEKSANEPAKKTSILTDVVKLPGATTPDKPATETPADVEDIAKGLQAPPENAKSHAGWQELKKKGNEAVARAAAAEKRAAELEAKLKASPAGIDEATKARLTQLEQENKTFSERLKVIDLKSHPEFQAKYVQPQQAAKEALAAIAKEDEVQVNVDELLSLRGKKFNQAVSETLENLTPYARVKFQAQLDQYLGATLGAEQALANAEEFAKAAQQNGGARARAAFDQASAGYKEHFVARVADEKATPAEKQSIEEYNAALAQVSKQAEAYAFGQLDEKTAADIAHKAALYDFTLTRGLPFIGQKFEAHIAAKDAKIAELEAQVKSLTAASPKVNGGAGAGTPESSEPADHYEAARRFVASGQ